MMQEISKTEKIWLNYFDPLWNKFWDELKGIDPKGCAVPHLPHCGDFPAYENSKYKFAFIGRDAYGWGNNLEKYSNSELADYLNDCKSEMEGGSNWREAKNPVFWNFIFKFLGEFYETDWNEIKNNADNNQIAQSIVWGNMRSVWFRDGETNMKFWNEVKTASEKFDSLQHVIDIFQPNVIVLLNYRDHIEHYEYRKVIDVNWEKYDTEKDDVGYFYLEDSKTHVFVTWHPVSMDWKSIDKDNLIFKIISDINEHVF